MKIQGPEHCPHCKVSLVGEEIPKEQRQSSTHWKREIGIEIPEKYDGIWYFQCPDCKGQWGGAREWRSNTEVRYK